LLKRTPCIVVGSTSEASSWNGNRSYVMMRNLFCRW